MNALPEPHKAAEVGPRHTARCVVLPYEEASQSGVGTEGKALARPLVVTDVGGLPELVADGSGTVVPRRDPHALAHALADVLTTPGLAERMSERVARAQSPSGWDRVAAMTLSAWDRRAEIG